MFCTFGIWRFLEVHLQLRRLRSLSSIISAPSLLLLCLRLGSWHPPTLHFPVHTLWLRDPFHHLFNFVSPTSLFLSNWENTGTFMLIHHLELTKHCYEKLCEELHSLLSAKVDLSCLWNFSRSRSEYVQQYPAQSDIHLWAALLHQQLKFIYASVDFTNHISNSFVCFCRMYHILN